MNGHFVSGNLRLARYLVRPAGRPGPLPSLIVCHGFPIGPLDARQSAGTFPELVDRAANDLGWVGMTFNFRGCGQSEGDFSLQGWVNDLRAARVLISATGPAAHVLKIRPPLVFDRDHADLFCERLDTVLTVLGR